MNSNKTYCLIAVKTSYKVNIVLKKCFIKRTTYFQKKSMIAL